MLIYFLLQFGGLVLYGINSFRRISKECENFGRCAVYMVSNFFFFLVKKLCGKSPQVFYYSACSNYGQQLLILNFAA